MDIWQDILAFKDPTPGSFKSQPGLDVIPSDVLAASTPGTNGTAKADHAHRGVRSLKSDNTYLSADVELVTGDNIEIDASTTDNSITVALADDIEVESINVDTMVAETVFVDGTLKVDVLGPNRDSPLGSILVASNIDIDGILGVDQIRASSRSPGGSVAILDDVYMAEGLVVDGVLRVDTLQPESESPGGDILVDGDLHVTSGITSDGSAFVLGRFLWVGVDDLEAADIRAYGNDSTAGGRVSVYNGATRDTTVDRFSMYASVNEDLVFSADTTLLSMFDVGNDHWTFLKPITTSAGVGATINDDLAVVGSVSLTAPGDMTMAGDLSVAGILSVVGGVFANDIWPLTGSPSEDTVSIHGVVDVEEDLDVAGAIFVDTISPHSASPDVDIVLNHTTNVQGDLTVDGTVIEGTRAWVNLYRSDALPLANTATWYDVEFNLAATEKQGITHDHTSNAAQVTFPAGTFVISYTLACYPGNNNVVFNSILIDTDSNELAGSHREVYVLGNHIHHLTGSVVKHFSAPTTIKLQVGCNAANARDISVFDSATSPDPTYFVSAALHAAKIGP